MSDADYGSPGVGYEESASASWVERRWLPETAGRLADPGEGWKRESSRAVAGSETYRVQLQCPRCTHAMSQTVRLGAVRSLWFLRRTFRHPVRDEVYVACNCWEPHPGRPEGRTGCGTAGVFSAPWAHSGAGQQIPARPAQPEDRRWTAKAEELEFTGLAEFRKDAERWLGLLGTATGGFGIIALLQGPGSYGDLAGWRVAAALGLLGVAAIALLGAFGYGLVAASGPTNARFYNNPIQVRDLYERDLLHAATRLRTSQLCALFAVGLLLVAAFVVWLPAETSAETSTSPRALVVLRSGDVLCGVLTVGGDGNASLRPTAATASTPLAGVVALQPVSDCSPPEGQ